MNVRLSAPIRRPPRSATVRKRNGSKTESTSARFLERLLASVVVTFLFAGPSADLRHSNCVLILVRVRSLTPPLYACAGPDRRLSAGWLATARLLDSLPRHLA